jgi:hypothetical protein
MTREEARQLERQLRERYPAGNVEVVRTWGGVEITVGSIFLRTTDDSPLLVLLGAAPERDLLA